MRDRRCWAPLAATFLAALLAACGGSGDGDQSPRVSYGKLVSFGDSLSDVGSYRVGAIAQLGGGEYSVNGATGVNWTELLAATAHVAAPCAAQTGLQSTIPSIPAVAVASHAGCYGYAQGGARVTDPIGVANAALPAPQLGQLTDPVKSQILRHLAASGGAFASDDLVTVLAGGNDVFMNLAAIQQGLTPTQAVTAMATAGGELGAYVKSLIVGNGAKHVVVVNLPDVSQTPFAYALDAPTQGLVNTMVQQFNAQLVAGVAGMPEVLVVDAYSQGRDQNARPAAYALTNVTTPACDLAKMALPTSLVCTANTLVAEDVSGYEFADTVHPTPFGYSLLARFIAENMLKNGWL
jgi:phospholipase/lecithinase/hemolysin